MTPAKSAAVLLGFFLGIAAMGAGARSPEADPRLASVQAQASEGRGGWDVVGLANPPQGVRPEKVAPGKTANATDHQARKREMVRRMFMLMVAYR
jgi:hypothetical protein